MPTLAGWLTGEQVPREVIEETLHTMENVLARHGGQAARTIQPGAGLVAFADPAYAMQRNDEPPVLDWVPERRTLVYRRPLSGMHPLYYVADWPAEGNLLFASEIRALLALGVPRTIRLAALDALLRYNIIPAPWTAFEHISVVPAGSILRWQRAKTVVNTSTDYLFDEPLTPADASEAQAMLDTGLVEATMGLLPPHEQLVALFNGDSPTTIALSLAAHYAQSPPTIASIDYKKSSSPIWRAAEQMATAKQLPFLAITGVDQPEFWLATIAACESPTVTTRALVLHQLLHASATETQARVALTALGANILTGAHTLESKVLPHAATTEWDPLQAYRQNAVPIRSGSQNAPSLPWSANAQKRLAAEEPWEETLHARKLARRAAQFSDHRQGLYYLDLHLRLPDLLTHDMVHIANEEQMAVRSPFLNPHMMETITRLPLVMTANVTRTSLIHSIAAQYRGEAAPSVPSSTLTAPAASLLRPQASELLRHVLSAEAIEEAGLFDPQEVERLCQQKKVSRALLLVFTTQLLCQIFQ